MAQQEIPVVKAKRHPTNIISIAPMYLLQSCFGTSVNFETKIDRGGYVTFIAQAVGGRDLTMKYASMEHTYDPLFFAIPGIRIYPTSMTGATKYCIGPSLFIGGGRKTTYQVDQSGYLSFVTGSRFLGGFIVNNSLNFHIGYRMYMALDYGVGMAYFDHPKDTNHGYVSVQQVSGRIGYRF